jgi:hypothetical protein
VKKHNLFFLFAVLLALPMAGLVAEEIKPRPEPRPAETLWEITEKARRHANTPESGIPMARYFVSGAVYYTKSDAEPAGWDVTWKKNEAGNDDKAGQALPDKIILHFYADGTTRCDGCISMEPLKLAEPPKP